MVLARPWLHVTIKPLRNKDRTICAHRPFASPASPSLGVGFGVVPALASAQVVEQQTIQINTGSGGGGSIQFPPGMGGGRQFKTGTGRIRGRVVSSDAAAPIRRAQVRISGQDIAPKAALTDGEGRFEFRDLPAGRFTLQASKSGFVSVQYGQTRPFEQGKPIELADKQMLDDADIAMPRGGVIAGRIVDEFGDPIPDATVSAMRQTWTGGRRRLTPAGGRVSQTNDLGQFRIYGLPPGDYVRQRVAARRRHGRLRVDGDGSGRGQRAEPDRFRAALRLRLHLLSGNAQRHRGSTHFARGRTGSERRRLPARGDPARAGSPASSSDPTASRSRAPQ